MTRFTAHQTDPPATASRKKLLATTGAFGALILTVDLVGAAA